MKASEQWIFIRAALTAALILATGSSTRAERVVILHVNDTHTRLLPTGPTQTLGGIAQAATVINSLRSSAEADNVLLMHAGDWSEGTFFHSYAAPGSLELQLLELIGFDVITIGNHDYLYDPDFFASKFMTERPTFPTVCANIDLSAYPELEDYIVPWVMFDTVAGNKVGVFGVTTTFNVYTQFAAPITFTAYRAAAEQAVAELQEQGANIIVALSHLGYTEDIDLAERIPGIHIVIGGHSHTLVSEATVVERADGFPAYVVQAFEWYKFVGRLEIDYDEQADAVALISYELHPVDDTVAAAPAVAALVNAAVTGIEDAMGDVFNDQVAELEHDLLPLSWECPLGNLITDTMTERGRELELDFDFTVMSDNFMSDAIYAGTVTTADVHSAFCYGYDPDTDKHFYMTTVGLNGGLWQFMLQTFYGLGFNVNMSGARAEFDRGAVVSLEIAGEPVEPTKIYRALMNNAELRTLQTLGLPVDAPTDTDEEIWPLLRDKLAELSPVTAADFVIDGRERTIKPDLAVFPHFIEFEQDAGDVGDAIDITVTVHNFGATAAVNGTLSVYYELTPDDWTDDPSYSAASLIGETELGGIPGMDAEPAALMFTWDTAGLTPGAYGIYAKITDVADTNGDAEEMLRNNMARSSSNTFILRAPSAPPSVNVAGLWTTRLTNGAPGTLTLVAWISDPDGLDDVDKVELLIAGQATGLQLFDDGAHGDFGSGDGLYALQMELPAGAPPAVYAGLQLVATDLAGLPSNIWPDASVK